MSPADGGRIATVERFFAALEAGDVDTVRAIYAEDARIWHNDGGAEQHVEDNLQLLRGLHQVVAALRYDVATRAELGDRVVQQHVLRGRLPDGTEVAMPAAMFLTVADGRVVRIEEYLDSAQAAPIRAARAALTAGA